MELDTEDAVGSTAHGHACSSAAAVMERLGTKRLIPKHEYVRLLQQSLHSLGYPEVARALEQRSVGS